MRVKRTMMFAASAAIVAAGVGLCAVPAQAAPASNTLVVSANQTIRTATHVASGALYGLSANGTPNQRYVAPLKPPQFVQMAPGGSQLPNGEPAPAGDSFVVAPEAAAVGAKVIVRMPDWYPNFPYGWVSWTDWLHAVDTQIASVQSSTATNIQAYELWNEPDWTWNTAQAGSFNAGWVRTYNEVRSKDTTTPIDGPSFSVWNFSLFQDFMSYAKANNAVPDIVSWHELQGSADIAADVVAYRSIESNLGISPRPIVIEEYGTPSEVGVPGPLAGYIAQFERSGVQSADLAFWNQYGTMGDTLVATGALPNASWWLYRWYGDMTGNMVATTRASSGLDGTAAVNSAGNQVSVVFGGGSGASAVTVTGLSSLSGFGSTAHVVLQQVISRGRTTPVSAPSTLTVGDFPVTGGSITVPVNAMNAANGYHLVVTPGGSTPSNLEGDYKLLNANSNLVLGVLNASTASGTAAVQWPDSGARDHDWNLVSDGNGSYKIQSENSGLVLGIQGSSTALNAPAVQTTDTGATSQLWNAVSAGSGKYKLVNKNSGLVLGINGASTAWNAAAVQWSDSGAADHLWTLVPTTPVKAGTAYTLTSVNSGLNLDTTNGATTSGTVVDQANASSSNTQKWTFIAEGNGQYKIQNVASGLYLGIDSASTAWNASAVIWTDNGGTDHLWQLEANGDGSYLIANANSGLVLGIDGASTASGTRAVQWGDSGAADHLWKIQQ